MNVEVRSLASRIDANQEEMKEEIKSGQAEIKATVSAILQKMTSWWEETKACLQKMGAYPEKMKCVAKNQDVPKEEAAVTTVRAVKKRYGDRHLAIRRRRQLRKRPQDEGGSRKKLVVARRGMTRRAGVAQRKGRGHTGLAGNSDQGQCSKRNLERTDFREEIGRNRNATTA
jgi:hypothetical protein